MLKKTVTITVTGADDTALDDAFSEAVSRIIAGNTTGFDSNEDSSFTFEVDKAAEDGYDDTPAITISRGQLNEFTGMTLTDEQVAFLAEHWSNSSIPEAFGAMTEGFPDPEDQNWWEASYHIVNTDVGNAIMHDTVQVVADDEADARHHAELSLNVKQYEGTTAQVVIDSVRKI